MVEDKVVARGRVTDTLLLLAMGCAGGAFVMFDVRWYSWIYVLAMTVLSLCKGTFNYCYGLEIGMRLSRVEEMSGCMM